MQRRWLAVSFSSSGDFKAVWFGVGPCRTSGGNYGEPLRSATERHNRRNKSNASLQFQSAGGRLARACCFRERGLSRRFSGNYRSAGSLFQSDPAVIEKLIRGMLKGLFHIRQSRSSTIPILGEADEDPRQRRRENLRHGFAGSNHRRQPQSGSAEKSYRLRFKSSRNPSSCDGRKGL